MRWIPALSWILFVLIWIFGSAGCDKDSSNPEGESVQVIYAGGFSPGYDMGVNTSGGLTDWVTSGDGYIGMAYPAGQAWGAVFVTYGEPIPPPRPGVDLSQFRIIHLELRGATGNETVQIGLKDNTDPDDGSETKIRISNIPTEWQSYEFLLSDFTTADLTRLYVVAEFVFETSPQTIYFRSIKYLL